MINYLELRRVTEQYSEEIESAISKVVHSGRYLLGEECTEFAKNYADYTGTKYCITCGNGLDALTLIFRAYKEMGVLKEEDEIIVPANTYIASILSVTENRLKPIFVEPKLSTLELDDEIIESHLTNKTKGILLVHLYGRCAYTDKISELCKRHNLLLIEDNAQAHGCENGKGVRTGALGNAAGHSFYPGKNLGALGDAGAVTTNDPELAEIVKILANYGSSIKYQFDYCGRNSRMDEIQAAVLNIKLKYLDSENNKRKQIAQLYYDNIINSQINLPHRMTNDTNVYHIFPILSAKRDLLQKHFLDKGIQTIIHYPIPPHKQSCYLQYNHYELPITEKIHREELSIPIGPYLSLDECEYIIDCMNNFI